MLRRLVVSWLATARGGAEKSSFELCAALAGREDLAVTLILWHHGGRIDFGPIARHGSGQVLHCVDRASYVAALETTLAEPTGTVLLSNHRTHALDLEIAARRGVPCAVLFRAGEGLRTLAACDSSELVYHSASELDWQALRRAAALVAVSEYGAGEIGRHAPPGTRVVRIYNGLPTAPDAAAPEARPLRRFVAASRLIAWKEIAFGLEAFAGLVRERPAARLSVAGEGEESFNLRALARTLGLSNAVEFLGYREDIETVYRANDALLHLSSRESFGRVVVEAAMHGLPAIVAGSAGTAELVVEGRTGFTFRPGDLEDCRRALFAAHDLDAPAAARLGAAARRRAEALFSLERAAEEYVGLAGRLVSRGR